MNNEQIKKRSAGAMWWSVLTQIAPKFVTPIVNMVLARLLAPEAFGAIATINLVITFAEVFTDAGFQKYIVQHEFKNEEELDKSTNVAFWTNIFVSLIFIAGISVFRNQIADLVGSPGLGIAIAISSVNILLVTLSSTQIARYNRVMNFRTLFYARICMTLVPLFITVPLAFVLRNYWALLIGTLVTNFLNAIVLTLFSKWKPRFYFSIKLFKEMFSFSSWLLLDSIAIWLTAYIGTLLVGRHLDDYYLGLYKTSITTVGSITNIITASVAPVMFSELSRCQNNDDEMKMTFHKYQRLSAIVLIPLGVGFFVFKDLVTWVLLGEQWGDAIDFIGIWGLMSAISIIFSNYCSTYYRSKGKPKIAFVSQVVYLAVLIPTISISVKNGFSTLYYARSFVVVMPIMMSFLIMKFMFGFKIGETVLNISPMIISALVMGVIGHLIKNVSLSYMWHFICVFVCIIVYFSVLLLFPKTRRDVTSLIFVQKIFESLKRKKYDKNN